MRRLHFCPTAFWIWVAVALPAMAQGSTAPAPASAWKTEVVATASQNAPKPIGVEVSPGWTLTPIAFSEIGYDSNPDASFIHHNGSGFIRSGAGFNLASTTDRMVASVSASGSMLDYLNEVAFDDWIRFAGAAKASILYRLEPTLTLSSSTFIEYDGQSANKNQTSGANAEVTYRDALVASTLRLRFLDQQYFNANIVNSLVTPGSVYDHNRSEATWIGLVGNSWSVAPYAEISAARVDYTNEPDPALLDRSADDYHVKGGLRLTLSPTLSTDVGWRFNRRNTEDPYVTSFESNSFDGSLTWKPSPAFLISASVERYIGEPSTFPAVLADVRSTTLKATYLPVAGLTISAAGGWQAVSDIGSGVDYHVSQGSAQVAWAYNNHVQLYTGFQYLSYQIQWPDGGYNDARVLTGLRIVPDGQDLLTGESIDSLLARLVDISRPSHSKLTLSAGYSWFGLPDLKMATVVGGPWFNQALSQETNGEGSLSGWRTDAGLASFAAGALPDGQLVSFGLSGFFANYKGTTYSHCMYSLTTDCALLNVVDSSSSVPGNTGPFGDLHITTSRDVDYYGIAVDGRLGSFAAAGLKDGAPSQAWSPFKLGVAMRGLSETANLTSVDLLVGLPLKYSESLDTLYMGAFIGADEHIDLGEGWAISLDAKAGLYYADTEYKGRYNGYSFLFPVGYFPEAGAMNSSLDHGSFIGTVRFDLKRDLRWAAVGAFAQGEFLSYVPRVAYNNNDRADGVLWGGITGPQAGSRIASESAFNFTTGLKIAIPLN